MRFSLAFIAFAASCMLTDIAWCGDAETKNSNEKGPVGDRAVSSPVSTSETEVENLTVYPAALPQPVLKYRLLSSFLELTPGNAATLYYRNFRALDTIFRDRKDAVSPSTLANLSDAPLSDLLKDEKTRSFLHQFSLKEIEYATRRTDCDWGIPFRESDDIFSISMPGIQDGRIYGTIITLKARLQIAEGNPAKAIDELRIGYGLARHLAQVPTLINAALGESIAYLLSRQLLAECQLKDAPNLYWSLTNLPHPLIDPHEAFDTEFGATFLIFKELSEAKTGCHSAEQWQEVWIRLVERYNRLIESSLAHDKPAPIDAQKVLKEKYSFVCEQLKKRGWSEKDVESKAPSHLMLLYCVQLCEEARDEELKWIRVPYAELPEDFLDQGRKLSQKYAEMEIVPLSQLMGVSRKLVVRMSRTEQLLAVLRTIEAIRLYASSHEGKLPAVLEEIKEVPVPLDPWTNKTISYRLQGDIGVISVKYPLRNQMEISKRATREYHIKIAE